MKRRRRFPGMFHRIFLSHLLLLLLAFVATVLLFAYMVAPGTAQFFLRSPYILFPAILALMGIAGLLSLWTAAAIAIPMDRSTEALRNRDVDALRSILPAAGSEELDEFLHALLAAGDALTPLPARSPLSTLRFAVLETDRFLNIHCISGDAEQLFHRTQTFRAQRNFRDLVHPDAYPESSDFLTTLRTPGRQLRDAWLTMRSADDHPFHASWFTLDRKDEDGTFLGKYCIGVIIEDKQ